MTISTTTTTTHSRPEKEGEGTRIMVATTTITITITVVSKILASIVLLFGICGMLAPTLVLDHVYHFSSPTTRLSTALIQDMSGMITGTALAVWVALFFFGATTTPFTTSTATTTSSLPLQLQTCLGLAGIPSFLLMAKWSFNQETPEFGMPIHNAYLLMVVLGIMVYNGLFPNQKNHQQQQQQQFLLSSKNILVVLSYFFSVHGVVGTCFPHAWAAAFGIEQLELVDVTLHRLLAASIGGLALLMHGFLPYITTNGDNRSETSTATTNKNNNAPMPIMMGVVLQTFAMAMTPTFLTWLAILLVWEEEGQPTTGMAFYVMTLLTVVGPFLFLTTTAILLYYCKNNTTPSDTTTKASFTSKKKKSL